MSGVLVSGVLVNQVSNVFRCIDIYFPGHSVLPFLISLSHYITLS